MFFCERTSTKVMRIALEIAIRIFVAEWVPSREVWCIVGGCANRSISPLRSKYKTRNSKMVDLRHTLCEQHVRGF